ncbi:MAG: hypothetical protein LBK61_09195 [Spirochaetaceae bacterium]|jgi:hypothetical protein|nr:hypothetical protein [Spirochaetaceae bacterium]
MLERENAFYTEYQTEFQEKYPDKWLVITGASLFGVYGTLHEAVENALAHFEPGEFMLHTPADDGKVLEIGPIIQFANNGTPEPEYVKTFTSGDLAVFPYA